MVASSVSKIEQSKISMAIALFFSVLSVSTFVASSPAAECEDSFKFKEGKSASNIGQAFSRESAAVYVLKFDTGAGYVRVVSGRIFMAERDRQGNVTSVEIFHDRGTGRYDARDVFHPLSWPAQLAKRHQWRKALGRDGYTRVHLIAADQDGVRFIGRTENGNLKFYQAHELFPLASSDR